MLGSACAGSWALGLGVLGKSLESGRWGVCAGCQANKVSWQAALGLFAPCSTPQLLISPILTPGKAPVHGASCCSGASEEDEPRSQWPQLPALPVSPVAGGSLVPPNKGDLVRPGVTPPLPTWLGAWSLWHHPGNAGEATHTGSWHECDSSRKWGDSRSGRPRGSALLVLVLHKAQENGL